MTGQVKEEILCRFGELGLRVSSGRLTFQPALLRKREFLAKPVDFHFLDVDGNWRSLPVAADSLAFTWCQVPFIYKLAGTAEPVICLMFENGKETSIPGMALPVEESRDLFLRTGRIRQVVVEVPLNVISNL